MVARSIGWRIDELMPALATRGSAARSPWNDLDAAAARRSSAFFREAVLPVLTPLAIDVSRPFPLLSSLSLNLALLLRRGGRRDRPSPGDRPGAAGSRRGWCGSPAPTARAFVPARGDRSARTCRSCSPARRFSSRRSSAWRATRSWSSTTKADARSSSWSSASCAGGAGAMSSGSRSAATSSPELVDAACATSSRSTPTMSSSVPGPLDLRVLMGARRICRASRSCAIRPLQPVDVLAGAQQTDLFAVLDERDLLLHHPYESLRSGRRPSGAGGGRSRRARDQADAVSHERRLADHRQPAARRRAEQAGHRARRADRAVRRGAQHPLGPRPRGGRRARDLRRPRLQDAREDLPDRQAHAAGPAALRPPRHRQLQRADGARLHRLRPADDLAGDRRGRERLLQHADRLLGSAAAEEADDGADRTAAAVSQADRARAPPGRRRASRRRSSPR